MAGTTLFFNGRTVTIPNSYYGPCGGPPPEVFGNVNDFPTIKRELDIIVDAFKQIGQVPDKIEFEYRLLKRLQEVRDLVGKAEIKAFSR